MFAVVNLMTCSQNAIVPVLILKDVDSLKENILVKNFKYLLKKNKIHIETALNISESLQN